jgi:hypothetical protein
MSSAGSSSSSSSSSAQEPAAAPAKRQLAKWPVLMETDGGREVHHLQVRSARPPRWPGWSCMWGCVGAALRHACCTKGSGGGDRQEPGAHHALTTPLDGDPTGPPVAGRTGPGGLQLRRR